MPVLPVKAQRLNSNLLLITGIKQQSIHGTQLCFSIEKVK